MMLHLKVRYTLHFSKSSRLGFFKPFEYWAQMDCMCTRYCTSTSTLYIHTYMYMHLCRYGLPGERLTYTCSDGVPGYMY